MTVFRTATLPTFFFAIHACAKELKSRLLARRKQKKGKSFFYYDSDFRHVELHEYVGKQQPPLPN